MAQAEQVLLAGDSDGLRVYRSVPKEWSQRDLSVLRLLADGRSTAGIAEDLAYSESTIKNVIHDLVRQLGARNRAHAVAKAIRSGLI